MTRRILVAVVASVLVSAVAHAQTPSKPGPEEQRLGVWVGSWDGEHETKAGPQGPAQKATLKTNCEWFTGNFQVVCRAEVTGPTGGKRSTLSILSYDHTKKDYQGFSISSNGQTSEAQVAVSGNAWTFSWEGVQQGKPAKFRTAYDMSSPTALTAKDELSQDGGKTWTVVGEGKGTKVK